MTEIVNDNRLTLILTQHGLSRIAEAILDPTINIEISNIRLGSGFDQEYYTPSEYQGELKGDLGLSFPVVEKNLLEDNQTVSFRAIIPETVGNFDIREVGLYENYNGEETLFAISTQQPFVKPSLDYGYIIAIDYYVFLKTVNVAEIYDQIVLDPNTSLVSDTDLETFMTTILFNHGNILNQIGNNSRIIGYNRATQLYEIIQENRANYSYISTYKNYQDINGMSTIQNYWLFDHAQKSENLNAIRDLGPNNFNLLAKSSVLSYEQGYVGLTPTLAFPEGEIFTYNNFTLPTNVQTLFAFALEPLDTSVTRTLLAQSNYSTNIHIFEIKEKPDGSVEVTLFQNASTYMTFTTTTGIIPNSGPHSIIVRIKPTSAFAVTVWVNGKQYATTSTGSISSIYSASYAMTSSIINTNGAPAETINSKVGLVARLTGLSNTDASMTSLLLEASLGRNPYLNRSY